MGTRLLFIHRGYWGRPHCRNFWGDDDGNFPNVVCVKNASGSSGDLAGRGGLLQELRGISGKIRPVTRTRCSAVVTRVV
eukprot:2915193-Pyramimonas_sp.AAC.1